MVFFTHCSMICKCEAVNFLNTNRVSENTFYEILDSVTDQIRKMDTIMRLAIPANERLALTIG